MTLLLRRCQRQRLGTAIAVVCLLFQFCLVVSDGSNNPESLATTVADAAVASDTTKLLPASTVEGHRIPPELSPWDLYPNLLNITDDDRKRFHPVVKFPMVWQDVEQDDDNEPTRNVWGRNRRQRRRVPNYQVMDLRRVSSEAGLAPEEETREARRRGRRSEAAAHHQTGYDLRGFSVGRYDENRLELYESDMFDDDTHTVDGFQGHRTVHMGMDLQGPLGTKVFSLCAGKVHSAGYNADRGDYGNVIVIEHDLGNNRSLWALYGHLDPSVAQRLKPGDKIRKGQFLGKLGDIHENGGW